MLISSRMREKPRNDAKYQKGQKAGLIPAPPSPSAHKEPDMSDIHYSAATWEDLPAIMELQGKNLFANLTPQQRERGFLSQEFSREMLQEVMEDVAIVKAFTSEELVGFRMAQTLAFNLRFPLWRAIIDRFPHIEFEGKKLSEAEVFITGPTCIAEAWRGKGVHEGMFKTMRSLARDRFDFGVIFISENNPRSLAAAQNRLGMQVVDHLTFDGKDYSVLAFSTKGEGLTTARE